MARSSFSFEGWRKALGPVMAFLCFRVLKLVFSRLWPRKEAAVVVETTEATEVSAQEARKIVTKKASTTNNKKKVKDDKKKKKPPLTTSKPKSAWIALSCSMSAFFGAFAWCYYRYGPLFFVNPKWKRLELSSWDWQNLLKTRSVAFVGGQHRSGTTVIWRSIATHPEVAWFGEERECGLDFSEGSFAQDVFPKFGIGAEFSASSLIAGTSTEGIGRYALGSPERILWTEERADAESQARVLNAFGYHWERKSGPLENSKVFLEKSPPNVVLARYLQALVDMKDDSEKKEFFQPPATSRARFIFVTRHPLANAASHQKFPGAKWLSTPSLVAHWLAVEHYADANAAHLQHVFRLKLETFAEKPRDTILALWAFLGLEADEERARVAAKRVNSDPNKKYREAYCTHLNTKQGYLDHFNLVRAFNTRVSQHGYDLDDYCPSKGYYKNNHPDDDTNKKALPEEDIATIKASSSTTKEGSTEDNKAATTTTKNQDDDDEETDLTTHQNNRNKIDDEF